MSSLALGVLCANLALSFLYVASSSSSLCALLELIISCIFMPVLAILSMHLPFSSAVFRKLFSVHSYMAKSAEMPSFVRLATGCGGM